MAESFSRQKSRHAPQKEGGLKKKILCDLSSCVTPAGTSNELDVQNGWEENTHTHTHVIFSFCQTGLAETHTKPCKTSPQGTSIKRPAIYWDHAVSWGGGAWVSVSDIGRVGKK